MKGRHTQGGEAALYSTDELCERYGCSPNTIASRWRAGKMPPPFNADQSRGWRWHREVIAAYERGEWSPVTYVGGVAS